MIRLDDIILFTNIVIAFSSTKSCRKIVLAKAHCWQVSHCPSGGGGVGRWDSWDTGRVVIFFVWFLIFCIYVGVFG